MLHVTRMSASTVASLFVSKLGVSLFQESVHPFLLVGSGKQSMKHAALKSQSFLQRYFLRDIDGFLAHNHTHASLGSNFGSHFDGFVDKIVCWKNLGYQTSPLHICGAHHITRQTHVHGLGLANRADQTLRSSSTDDRILMVGLVDWWVRVDWNFE